MWRGRDRVEQNRPRNPHVRLKQPSPEVLHPGAGSPSTAGVHPGKEDARLTTIIGGAIRLKTRQVPQSAARFRPAMKMERDQPRLTLFYPLPDRSQLLGRDFLRLRTGSGILEISKTTPVAVFLICTPAGACRPRHPRSGASDLRRGGWVALCVNWEHGARGVKGAPDAQSRIRPHGERTP